jgi:protein O-GlcNAc transferase
MSELSIPQLIEAMIQSHSAGNTVRADLLARQVLSREPENADALHLLGLISSQRGEQETARDFLERAIEANPLCAQFRTNLGVVLEALGRLDEAAATYRLALEVQPDLVDAHKNLGIVLGKLGRPDESIAAWRATAEICRDDADILNSLGAALYAAGQTEASLLEFAKAIELRPNFAEAYNNAGNALFSRGDADVAIVAYQKAVAIKPDLTDARSNLANALNRSGRQQEALHAQANAATARPDHAPTQIAAGDALGALGLWDAAVDSYRRAIQIEPQNHAAALKLANALLAKRDLDGAVAAYRRVLQLQPNSVEAYNNLGDALREQGSIDDSLDCFETAMNLAPGNAAIHSNLIYLLSYHPGYDPVELSRQQKHWNDQHAAPVQGEALPHDNDPNADRRLKIGYVLADLRPHGIGQRLLPILTEHDRGQFEIYSYSTAARPDALWQLPRRHANFWRDVADFDDNELAETIRRDGIDILVDLSQHMPRNRLLVFARKPAPVQVTWLGYCSSTGLGTIDYRLSDPYLDPPETDLSVYSEQTLRLHQTCWCYACAGPAPEPSPSPADSAGFITFGCLNSFAKASPGALDLWAEILAAVGRSRMIIHSYPGSHVDAVRERFAAAGVSSDRLEFITRQPWSQYIQTYSRIDIALDPFPFGGGITTCDALWMGVPVVSLAGQTAVSRQGRSILSNIGLPELVARRPRQYVQTTVTLAQSPARLAELRRTMRHRMLTSPLMNSRRLTRNIENVYRQMWRQWRHSTERSG